MRKIALAFAAAAALAISAEASATVSTIDYSVNGPDARGTFSLDFDDSSSTYSLDAADLILGTAFTQADAVLSSKNSTLYFVGTPGGILDGTHQFGLSFDPALTSQTGIASYNDAGVSGIQTGTATILRLGMSGSTIDYSVNGPNARGTFSIDFDSGTSTYSLDSLDLVLGTPFTEADSVLSFKNPTLYFVGSPGGINAGTHEYGLSFDPALASQTGIAHYNEDGSPGILTGTAAIVRVAASPSGVPEPTSWAMMLVGFGAIAAAIRRRRKTPGLA